VSRAGSDFGDTLNQKIQKGNVIVANKVIVRAIPQSDSFEWAALSGDGIQASFSESVRGTLADLADTVKQFTTQVQLVFLVPAVDALVRVFDFTDKERKHVLKTIPYLIEDDLLGEADDLHIVHGKAKQNQITVAAIDEHCLQHWLDQFSSAGIKIDACVPEQCFLPSGGHEWVMYYSDGRFMVRFNERQRFAFDADAIELALQIATNGWSELPTAIDLRVSQNEDQHDAEQLLPAPLRQIVSVTVQPWLELYSQYEQQATSWNFLQGKFARLQQWNSYWNLLKVPVLVLVAAFFIQLTIAAIEYSSLKSQNLASRAQLDAAFREIFPRGQIVDHRRQVENELKRLKGGAGSGGFVALLQKVGGVLITAQGLNIQSLTYDSKNGELRLDVLVRDYPQVETILKGVKREGLDAELQSSNAQGSELRARLTISGAQ